MNLQDREKARGRLKRRGYPIAAYIGKNGSGKSRLAVYDSLLSLDYGRPVLSTVRLLDFRDPGPCPGGLYCDDPEQHLTKRFRWEMVEQDDGPPLLTPFLYETGEVHAKRHPFFVPWRSYQQLIAWRDGDVLADEITGFASSREIKNMPPQVANFLVQLRRRNIVLRWTTPSWGRADTIIREVTQAVTLCAGMFPKKRPPVAGEAPMLWRDSRVFLARTYDPQEFDEVEARRLDNAAPESQAWYVGRNRLAERAYATGDGVTALGWANEAGMCIECGGVRKNRACGCRDRDKAPDAHDTMHARAGTAGPPPASGARRGADPDLSSPPPLLLPVGGAAGGRVAVIPRNGESPHLTGDDVVALTDLWSSDRKDS